MMWLLEMEERLPPIHPGEVLLEDFMQPFGLSQYRVAKDIGISPLRISQIVHGYPLNNPGKRRSQTAYEPAFRGSATPVGPHLLKRYVHGKRAITADTALCLARYFGTSAAVWLRLQARNDLEMAEIKTVRSDCVYIRSDI